MKTEFKCGTIFITREDLLHLGFKDYLSDKIMHMISDLVNDNMIKLLGENWDIRDKDGEYTFWHTLSRCYFEILKNEDIFIIRIFYIRTCFIDSKGRK